MKTVRMIVLASFIGLPMGAAVAQHGGGKGPGAGPGMGPGPVPMGAGPVASAPGMGMGMGTGAVVQTGLLVRAESRDWYPG